MKIKNFKTILFILLFSNLLSGQNIELGNVTIKELEEKSHPIEKDAPAAILFSKGDTYLEFYETDGVFLITEVEMKIKIYSKEGYNWANTFVRYFIGGAPSETVYFFKAFTYNLENGKIEKTKLKSEAELTQKINKYLAERKFTMPNVKEGSIIEYKYKIKSPYVFNVMEWPFQNIIPVNYSRFTTTFPEFFEYKANFKGGEKPKITTKTAVSKLLSTNRLDYISIYETKMLPAMQDEKFVDNIKNYFSSVNHEVTAIKYPGAPIEFYSNTWDDVVKKIYNLESFGSELEKTSYFEDDLAKLINGVSSPTERVELIFNYVKNKMTWNKLEGYFCNEGLREAYKTGVGNVAEINLLLTLMLQKAGVSANPVLLSTRENGNASYPSIKAYNYVIAAVEIPEGLILLDATEKNTTVSVLPLRTLSSQGRLIRRGGSSTSVQLRPSILSKEMKQVMAKIEEDGNLSGKARIHKTEYNAYKFREIYFKDLENSYVENLEKSNNNIQIENFSVSNVEDLSKPVIEEFNFNDDQKVEIIGSKMYLSPMLFYQLNENPFKLEKREYPIDFLYPQQEKYSFSISIPDGYTAESLPSSLSIALENNSLVYKYTIQLEGNVIKLNSILDINHAVITATYYEDLKDFFKKIVEKHAEKVVLIKK